MTDSENKTLQAKKKAEVAAPAEQTRPGPTFIPAVDIVETDQEVTVLADMPGVGVKDINIDLGDDMLTLVGNAASPEGENEVDVFSEYLTGKYARQFTLSHEIDQPKIGAEMKDGVLRLKLPKLEAAKPRKITVKVG